MPTPPSPPHPAPHSPPAQPLQLSNSVYGVLGIVLGCLALVAVLGVALWQARKRKRASPFAYVLEEPREQPVEAWGGGGWTVHEEEHPPVSTLDG